MKFIESLSPPLKFFVVLLINFFIPGLGNLVVVGRSFGNCVLFFFCFWAWTGGNHAVTFGWAVLMAIKAFADIFPPQESAESRMRKAYPDRVRPVTRTYGKSDGQVYASANFDQKMRELEQRDFNAELAARENRDRGSAEEDAFHSDEAVSDEEFTWNDRHSSAQPLQTEQPLSIGSRDDYVTQPKAVTEKREPLHVYAKDSTKASVHSGVKVQASELPPIGRSESTLGAGKVGPPPLPENRSAGVYINADVQSSYGGDDRPLSSWFQTERDAKESGTAELLNQSTTANMLRDSKTASLLNESTTANMLRDSKTASLLSESTTANMLKDSKTEGLLNESTTANMLKDSKTENLLNRSTTADMLKDSMTTSLIKQSTSSNVLNQSTSPTMVDQASALDLAAAGGLGSAILESSLLRGYSDPLQAITDPLEAITKGASSISGNLSSENSGGSKGTPSLSLGIAESEKPFGHGFFSNDQSSLSSDASDIFAAFGVPITQKPLTSGNCPKCGAETGGGGSACAKCSGK